MNKQIIGIIMGMVLISLVSAVSYDLIAGKPYVFDLNETYEYYSIVGNSTSVDLNITQNGTIVTILTSKYSQTDSFEIIFFNQETEIITEHHYSSSGGGGTNTIYVENKTIIEVDNYIDREVYLSNETEVPSSDDKIKELEGDLNKRKRLVIVLIIALIICVISFVILLKYICKEQIKMNKKDNLLKDFWSKDGEELKGNGE